jgi:sugar-specific transcriptional regulator TrmB
MELLGARSMGMLELSRATNIPRSSVYRIASELVKMKFAEWVVDKRGNEIKVVLPEQLGFVVEDKKEELGELQDALHNLKDMVGNIVSGVPKTQVRYYQGVDGLRQILWNALSAKKYVIGYSEFGRIEPVGQKFYDRWVKEFKVRKLSDRVITNEKNFDYLKKYVISTLDRHQLDKTGIRIIPSDIYYCTGDHSLYNDVYAMSYWKKGEIVGVEIENSELVKMHKSIFELLWGIAKPLDEYLDNL